MTPLVLLGPTASGKSALAMALAKQLTPAGQPIEIISADSMVVYREMDIGTAKPSPADRAEVPHWCVDLVDPSEEYTVRRYQQDARRALADIESRGAQALIVGGTGLYIRAVVDDIDIPGQFPQVRAELDESHTTDQLYAKLSQADPLAASRIEPGNRRRLLRALEVTLGSGRKFSDYGAGLNVYQPTDIKQVGLRLSRPDLNDLIARRLSAQLEAGLAQEAKDLLERPAGLGRTARQALAYKELFAHFDGATTMEEAVEQALNRTRRFSRRQMRWFKRDPRISWIDLSPPESDSSASSSDPPAPTISSASAFASASTSAAAIDQTRRLFWS